MKVKHTRNIVALTLFCLSLCTACATSHTAVSTGTVHLNKYCVKGSDATATLQALVDRYNNIIIDKGTWLITGPVYLRSGVSIRGEGTGKSILKVSEEAIMAGKRRMCVFTSLKITTPIYIQYGRNLSDYFTVKIKNVNISDITIDLNRHPDTFTKRGWKMATAEVEAIHLENCTDCIIENCEFRDYMESNKGNEVRNNGSQVVRVVKSTNITVTGCTSKNCGFLMVDDCENVKVASNIGVNTVGTWIETTAGGSHTIEGNILKGIMWKVSSIGVNSTNCNFVNNEVTNTGCPELSCLTLGHEQKGLNHPVSADSCYVSGNTFTTDGNRCVLIQNGRGIVMENNTLSSIPKELNYVSGVIVIRGQNDNFAGLVVKNNRFAVPVPVEGSVLAGANLDGFVFEGNTVNADCGRCLNLYGKAQDVSVKDNSIVLGEGSNLLWASSVTDLRIQNNKIEGGSMSLASPSIIIRNNEWTGMKQYMTIYDTKDQPFSKTVIEDNDFTVVQDFQGVPVRFVKQSNGGKSVHFEKGKNKLKISK